MFVDRAKNIYQIRKRRRRRGYLQTRTVCYRREVRTAETADSGGDVIFQADRNLRTLMDFKYKRNMKQKTARTA